MLCARVAVDFSAVVVAGLSIILLLDGQIIYSGRDNLGLQFAAKICRIPVGGEPKGPWSSRLAAILALVVAILLVAAAFVAA